MKHKIYLIIFIMLLIISCKTTIPKTKETVEVGITLEDLESLNFIGFYDISESSSNNLIYNQLTGTITRYSNDPLNSTNFGKYVEFRHNFMHQVDDKIKNESYYTIYGMLGDILVNFYGELDAHMEIGKTGGSGPIHEIYPADLLLCAWSYEKTDYLIDYLGGEPVKYNGIYWYPTDKIVK